MTNEELKKLGKKIVAGESTNEEKIIFLNELNALIAEVRNEVAEAKKEDA